MTVLVSKVTLPLSTILALKSVRLTITCRLTLRVLDHRSRSKATRTDFSRSSTVILIRFKVLWLADPLARIPLSS